MFWEFFFKFQMYLFTVKHCIGSILRMVGWIDMKQKGCALDGFWVNYVTWNFDLTPDFDLGSIRLKVGNNCI